MGFFNKKNNTIEENKNMIDKNVKNYNVLDFSNLLKINNQNLNRILVSNISSQTKEVIDMRKENELQKIENLM